MQMNKTYNDQLKNCYSQLNKTRLTYTGWQKNTPSKNVS